MTLVTVQWEVPEDEVQFFVRAMYWYHKITLRDLYQCELATMSHLPYTEEELATMRGRTT